MFAVQLFTMQSLARALQHIYTLLCINTTSTYLLCTCATDNRRVLGNIGATNASRVPHTDIGTVLPSITHARFEPVPHGVRKCVYMYKSHTRNAFTRLARLHDWQNACVLYVASGQYCIYVCMWHAGCVCRPNVPENTPIIRGTRAQ